MGAIELSREELPIRARPLQGSDENFIYSSWLKSFRPSASNAQIRKDIYFRNQSGVIRDILSRSHGMVAADREDSSHLFGYVIAEFLRESTVVHYVYVKHPFRRLGIGRFLIQAVLGASPDDVLLVCSHIPAREDFFTKFLEKYSIVYDPSYQRRVDGRESRAA